MIDALTWTSVRECQWSLFLLPVLQALDVNLNPLWYGVMAEIGAGQVRAAETIHAHWKAHASRQGISWPSDRYRKRMSCCWTVICPVMTSNHRQIAAVMHEFEGVMMMQEVSRWFFRVGGAAGTIAKSVSAYGMSNLPLSNSCSWVWWHDSFYKGGLLVYSGQSSHYWLALI